MQETQSRRLVSGRMLILAVGVIALSTALFVSGVVIERGGGAATTSVSSSQATTPTTTLSGDPDGGHEGAPANPPQGAPAKGTPGGGTDERVFGLDLENPWLVSGFVLLWLALIAGLIRLGRLAWVALLLIALLATVLDVGEVLRKVGEANTTVASIAVLVAIAHGALVVLAAFVLARSIRGRTLSFHSGG